MPKKNYNLRVEKTPFLKGMVQAPPSKSYTIRALIAAGLNGNARILNPLLSEDTIAAVKALKALGSAVRRRRYSLEVRGFKGRPVLSGGVINVGESGTLLRMILPVAALLRGKCRIDGRGTILKRTNKPIAQALLSMGVAVRAKEEDFRLPIIIEGCGRIKGGEVKVSGKISSQAISSLLSVAGLAEKDVHIRVSGMVVSRPYIDITLDVLRQAGIKVRKKGYGDFYIKSGQAFRFREDFTVHGDYSSAAFLIAAACLLKSEVVITDMARDKQGDRRIINILNRMGARIKHSGNEVRIRGPFSLKGLDIDCSDTPDLVPILAVIGCFASGRTRLYNIGHLAHKESNRVTEPAGELRKLGADISIGADNLIIRESALRPGTVCSRSDHRIAMSLAVAGLRTGGVTIQGAGAINKSYPDFIRDMRSLGAKIIAS